MLTAGQLLVAREATYLYVTCILDIVSDSLLVSIPVSLLSRVKITTPRKLVLGTTLSLSVFMIAISLIRVTDSKLSDGVTDSVWLCFLTSMEGCAAICMVSLTAFRSIFHRQGSKSSKSSKSSKTPTWKDAVLRTFRRNKLDDQEPGLSVVQFPGATLTGMRTMIDREGREDDGVLAGDIEKMGTVSCFGGRMN
jgi:hypothetical protein